MNATQLVMEPSAVVDRGDGAIELEALRRAIDGVDDALAGLLACRVRLSRQAQATKRRVGFPVFDGNREAEIQRRFDLAAPGSAAIAAAITQWCRSGRWEEI